MKKDTTPPSTPTQEEESLSPNSPDTQEYMDEEKSREDSASSDTPSSTLLSQKVRFDGPKSPNLHRKGYIGCYTHIYFHA